MKNYENILRTAGCILDLVSYASPRDTHGPVVQTGPTRGQNRSRNKNGRWRKKRSDTGKSRI